MHGNVRLLVCVECGNTVPLTSPLARQLKAQQLVPCAACRHEAMRFKVMMYEDAESESLIGRGQGGWTWAAAGLWVGK